MNLFLLKYLVPLVGLIAVLFAVRRWRKRELPTGLLVAWTLLWVALSLVVQLPQQTDVLARILGVGRGVDVLLFASVVALVLLLFRVYLRIERMEREITTVVRELALLRAEQDKK